MRNHLGLTAKQSAFVARGGMQRTKSQTRKARVYGSLGPYLKVSLASEPIVKSGEFKGFPESIAARILALRKYFNI